MLIESSILYSHNGIRNTLGICDIGTGSIFEDDNCAAVYRTYPARALPRAAADLTSKHLARECMYNKLRIQLAASYKDG